MARRRLGSRASVAVEFALCASFLLLPLFAGGVDFVEIISAQAQLNTALQSLYLFAYTDPAAAGTGASITAVITKINAGATHQVVNATSNNPISYKCMNAAGTVASYSSSCASGYTKQTFVTYALTGSVSLTAPLPFGLTSPFSLRTSGTVQIQ